MHADNEPPGQSLGVGLGVGTGLGAGTGLGVGTGVGTADTTPLLTQPPHWSSLGESTALFIQHSPVACTKVKPTQPEVAEH